MIHDEEVPPDLVVLSPESGVDVGDTVDDVVVGGVIVRTTKGK